MGDPRFSAIILAAGRSSRMGRPKGLIRLGAKSILDRLTTLYAAHCDPVIVVASGETLEAAQKITCVRAVPGNPAAPMIDSIALAVDQIPAEAVAAVIQPVDAPFTSARMLEALTREFTGPARALVHEETPGHPIIVSRTMFAEIQKRPDGGLRHVLEAVGCEKVPWPEEHILADLDTPEDLEHWMTKPLRAL